MMKKSTFGAILAFLFVAAGALTAAALYLRRREKELDEYENLLFSDDLDDYDEDEDTIYESIGDDETDTAADTSKESSDSAESEDGLKF